MMAEHLAGYAAFSRIRTLRRLGTKKPTITSWAMGASRSGCAVEVERRLRAKLPLKSTQAQTDISTPPYEWKPDRLRLCQVDSC